VHNNNSNLIQLGNFNLIKRTRTYLQTDEARVPHVQKAKFAGADQPEGGVVPGEVLDGSANLCPNYAPNVLGLADQSGPPELAHVAFVLQVENQRHHLKEILYHFN